MSARVVSLATFVLSLSACAAQEARAPQKTESLPVAPATPMSAPAVPPSSDAKESTPTSVVPAVPAPNAMGGSAPAPPPMDDIPHAQARLDESSQRFASAGSDCAKMCKALASMENAAGHLCELVKDAVAGDKKRCIDAKARVDHARERVLSMCGGCD